jgi:hypothetical protein
MVIAPYPKYSTVPYAQLHTYTVVTVLCWHSIYFFSNYRYGSGSWDRIAKHAKQSLL